MASLGLRASLFQRSALAIATVLVSLFAASGARAQDDQIVTREATFAWDDKYRYLYLDMNFRDIIDADLEAKLSGGFTTTIVLTAVVYRAGAPKQPLSTVAQSCKVKWDVWQEVYFVDRTVSGVMVSRPSPTIEGVLRSCAQANHLLAGDRIQVPRNVPIYALGQIQVNPRSQAVLDQIQRWVMRPNGTSTVGAGDALFSTFQGLFLQRIGPADRQLNFTTPPRLPKVLPEKR